MPMRFSLRRGSPSRVEVVEPGAGLDDERVGRAIVGVGALHELVALGKSGDEVAAMGAERVAHEPRRLRIPDIGELLVELRRQQLHDTCSRTLRLFRWRTEGCLGSAQTRSTLGSTSSNCSIEPRALGVRAARPTRRRSPRRAWPRPATCGRGSPPWPSCSLSARGLLMQRLRPWRTPPACPRALRAARVRRRRWRGRADKRRCRRRSTSRSDCCRTPA